jgi:hypothetical protein
MAATAAAAAAALYSVAVRWNDASDDERRPLKELVTRLVGYPCKVACQTREEDEEHRRVEIFVLSDRTGEIDDFLELQPSGAIGLIYDQYDDPDAKRVVKVDDRCEAYNEGLGVSFEEHSDSEDEEGSEEDDSDSEEGAEAEAEAEVETEKSKEKKD